MYANAAAFGEAARNLVDSADPPPRVLVVDCEEMFTIDFTGTEAVESLVADMRDRSVDVRLARVHGIVMTRLRAAGVIETLGEGNVFGQIADAVAAAPPPGR